MIQRLMVDEITPERRVCIHGHFYQPPRENPWTGRIEQQPGASPFHDWNQRITVESYEPNSNASILGPEGSITRHVNNYSRMSFNFGPTLLRWMQQAAPATYAAILNGEAQSRERFSGHSSAIAQAYHHSILPLANRRDKETEVHWGIRDFEWRFGRRPEGIWLAETAVDVETLEVLANQGIRYTILSPFQASKIRQPGDNVWRDVSGGRIETSRPYRVSLPSGASIALFFYEATIARAVAFEKLLENGNRFATRLRGAFQTEGGPQLVSIATDGETYGHHHKFGEMALAYALQVLDDDSGTRLSVYGEYLAQHPPDHEVKIAEVSSWSCTHGVGRWQKDCSCHTGGKPGWNQKWRGPLRESLNWLRDELAPLYESAAGKLFEDPWGARNWSVELLLDNPKKTRNAAFSRIASHPLSEDERTDAVRLLELQRNALMMYTSCGWFFNDLAGIETVQILRYAARAIELGRDLFQKDLESGFLKRLAGAKSNDREEGDGAQIYRRHVVSP